MTTSQDKITDAIHSARMQSMFGSDEFDAFSAHEKLLEVVELIAAELHCAYDEVEEREADDYDSTFVRTANSLYEVDETNGRVRRLCGVNNWCEKFCGEDWRDFVDHQYFTVGQYAQFLMNSGDTIWTSRIVAIERPFDWHWSAIRHLACEGVQ